MITETLTLQESQRYEEVEQLDIQLKHSRTLQEAQQWQEIQRISFLLKVLKSQKSESEKCGFEQRKFNFEDQTSTDKENEEENSELLNKHKMEVM